MNNQSIKLELEVRDYECDMEGIVNNAVYLNYLEHARHSYLKLKGFDFTSLTQKGIHLVVIRIEADYIFPLRSGEKFAVTASVERISKLRLCFNQEIYRLSDNKPIMRAKVIGTSLNAEGQPKYFEEFEKLL